MVTIRISIMSREHDKKTITIIHELSYLGYLTTCKELCNLII